MFSILGDEKVFNNELCADAEKVVCSMYGQKKLFSVAEARHEMFLRKYRPKIGKNPISVQKRWMQFFASMFPSYFAETKKDKLRLQGLAEFKRGFPHQNFHQVNADGLFKMIVTD